MSDTPNVAVTAAAPDPALSLVDRFKADTPTVFKLLAWLAGLLGSAIGFLSANALLPSTGMVHNGILGLGAVCATAVIVFPFIVKNYNTLQAGNFSFDTWVKLIPTILQEYHQVQISSNKTFSTTTDADGLQKIAEDTKVLVSDPVLEQQLPDVGAVLQTIADKAPEVETAIKELVGNITPPATIG